jgi:hypothetical protein
MPLLTVCESFAEKQPNGKNSAIITGDRNGKTLYLSGEVALPTSPCSDIQTRRIPDNTLMLRFTPISDTSANNTRQPIT